MRSNGETNGILADTAWGIAILAVACLLLWVSYQHQGFVGGGNKFGIMFWPRVLLSGMVVISCIMLAALRLGMMREPEEGGSEPPRVLTWPSKSFVFTILASVAYLVLIHYVGFVWAALIFSIVVVKWLWLRSWAQALVFSGLWTLLLWGLFIKLMRVPLPKGVGIFREISVIIY